ncbi:hypothetical protein [Burkholderia cepacia]|uniref:hypothetical protein n=1 Tax=Burkholderia cepacia TaxID=292 RepID=UPI002FE26A70
MKELELGTAEFTFFPIGLDDGEAAHRAVFVGAAASYVVNIFRINSKKSLRIGVDIPRPIAEAKQYNCAADVVRDAIGQALRDNLFNNPPTDMVYLDEDAPRWKGNLEVARK